MAIAHSADGTRLHFEVEGSGPPVLLHHGFAGRGERWRTHGYVDALRDAYQLILLDARGHGLSDRPPDIEAYAIDRRVEDVTAVLDAMGLERVHFVGYSMGGVAGFGVAKYAPDRLASLVIGGAHPYALGGTLPAGQPDWPALLTDGIEAAVAAIERQTGAPIPEPDRSGLLLNDHRALIACYHGVADAPGLDDGVTELSCETLIYCGSDDPYHAHAKQAATAIPRAEFVTLPGLRHLDGFHRSDLVLPHIARFLASVTAG